MELINQRGDRVAHSGAILALLCCAQLMLGLDVTIVTVANPAIQRALGFTTQDLQWTVTAYSLTIGGFLLLGGRLSDLFGRRRLFIIGISAFTAASLVAGVAQTVPELILARAIQGLSGAVIAPTTLALLTTTFPQGAPRQRALGVWSTASAMGGVIGFLIGGVLTGIFGWRSIFFINLPIGIGAVAAALLLVPKHRVQGSRTMLDVRGACFVTAGLGLLIYGLGDGQTTGWSSPQTLASLTISVALIVAFLVIEERVPNPLLPLALLRRRESVALVILVTQSMVISSTVFLESLYMQRVFGYSPLRTGFASLPLPLGVMLGSNLSSRLLLPRFGTRAVTTLGLSGVVLGLGWFSQIPDHGQYTTSLLPSLALLGTGLSIASVCLAAKVTSNVRPDQQGVVGSLFNMTGQIGSALGVAAFVTIADAATKSSHLSGSPAEAHGIRTAFLVSALLAGAATLLSVTLLSDREPADNLVGPLEEGAVRALE